MSAPGINDFTLRVATVNGTGSASANGLLMKAIFRMGVPVVGKNIFPSNIQGLPTWYEIRVTGDGHAGRDGEIHFVIAMNPETYADDLASLAPGGVLLYDSTWPRPQLLSRPDVTVLGAPLSAMCNEAFKAARSRILMKNMAYVGAAAALLDLDLDVIKQLVTEMFAGKEKLIPLNMQAVELGRNYALQNFTCPLNFRTKPMEKAKGKIMIDGNTAAGLGMVYGGATFGAWYPITPSTSLMDAFQLYCDKLRVDADTGLHNYCILQAEDELAAAGLVIGASWAGARGFTPTSGPGISLMSEFIGFAYYTEVPLVICDIQRVGPSTGMPTRTQQCDIQLCAYASHGDTRHLVLYPAHPGECFEFAAMSLDLAERFQTPVFFLSDIDIGMNDWMVDELTWPEDYVPDRGKVLSAEDLEETKAFYRYLDVDGDAIPYRTLPGTHKKGAYFLRGSGHTKLGRYTEKGEEYKEVVDRLYDKWKRAAAFMPAPVVTPASRPARLGIIAIGSSDGAVREARDRLEAAGMPVDYMRIRGFPFSDEVAAFVEAHDEVFVVEQNRDAQLLGLIITETAAQKEKLTPVLHYSGEPLNYRFVYDAIENAVKVRKIA
ncbi:MAG: 2-oxoacid:acceptor oxidoreductase subunit alpha [Hyphomonas sp.]|nr:2-oxoacid:acceptor oxidoreductase subunit alpha [Hyphomonas sp.]